MYSKNSSPLGKPVPKMGKLSWLDFESLSFQYVKNAVFIGPYQTMQLNWKALLVSFLLFLLILNGAFDCPFFDPSANRGNRAWWPKLSFKLYSATY